MQALFEFGPIVAFFVTYKMFGMMEATAILIVLTLVSSTYLYFKNGRKLPMNMIATAVIVAIFGGLTLWFDDERFIKMKPTVINILFSSILFFGYIRGKGFIKHVMGQAINVSDEVWLRISRNYAIFFLTMAMVNEIVWRNFSTDTWVSFKLFGFLGLTIIFSIFQFKNHMDDKQSVE